MISQNHRTIPEFVELFEFRRGTEVWRFVGSTEALNTSQFTWSPKAISRGQITRGNDKSGQSCTLTMPAADPFCMPFAFMSANGVTNVRVFECSIADKTQRIVWQGRVSNVSFKGIQCELRCISMVEALERNITPAVYQKNCPWKLYGQHTCRAKEVDSRFDCSVLSQQGNSIRISGVTLTQNFVGGSLRVTVDGSMLEFYVLSVSGDSIIVDIVPPNITGKIAHIFYGCDFTFTTCRDRFHNQLNYGGYLYIPDKCPMDGTLVF